MIQQQYIILPHSVCYLASDWTPDNTKMLCMCGRIAFTVILFGLHICDRQKCICRRYHEQFFHQKIVYSCPINFVIAEFNCIVFTLCQCDMMREIKSGHKLS